MRKKEALCSPRRAWLFLSRPCSTQTFLALARQAPKATVWSLFWLALGAKVQGSLTLCALGDCDREKALAQPDCLKGTTTGIECTNSLLSETVLHIVGCPLDARGAPTVTVTPSTHTHFQWLPGGTSCPWFKVTGLVAPSCICETEAPETK